MLVAVATAILIMIASIHEHKAMYGLNLKVYLAQDGVRIAVLAPRRLVVSNMTDECCADLYNCSRDLPPADPGITV